MQSMQRSFGKLLQRSPGDNAKVSILLNDYEDVDAVLAKLIDCATSWRDSWINLTNAQLGIATEYEGLYDPIEGSARAARPGSAASESQLNRTFKLREAYSDIKTDFTGDIEMIETRVIQPMVDTRGCLAPLRKTIKKRENKRLDYENAQEKTVKLQRKPGKSPKEKSLLEKLEGEEAKFAEAFQVADNHIRQILPPIVTAAFSMVPPILETIIMMQNQLLGMYYTVLHDYCEGHQFPSPPPPMSDVIGAWSKDFNPAKREFESIGCVAHGKAARQPMFTVNDTSAINLRKPSSTSAQNLRRSSSNLAMERNESPSTARPQVSRIPSMPMPKSNIASIPRSSTLGIPTEFTTASGYGRKAPSSAGSADPRSDYFDSNWRNGSPSPQPDTISDPVAILKATVARKRPPPPKPPPKPKQIPARKPEEFVVALYPFTGQGAGDLNFQEGDRIRIIRKTHTDQDWWEGELGGAMGSFPANYCRPA